MSSIRDAINNATAYLKEHPEEAAYTDSPAVATLSEGLKVDVEAPDGQAISTDMPKGVGGAESAPSAGWLFRAALAACDTTLIAMRAATMGVDLQDVQVSVDSESNDYGILAIDETVPPGPISVRTKVRVRAKGAEESQIRELVEWAVAHCPVSDATKRAVPMTLEIESS